jgi:hypothetical protein
MIKKSNLKKQIEVTRLFLDALERRVVDLHRATYDMGNLSTRIENHRFSDHKEIEIRLKNIEDYLSQFSNLEPSEATAAQKKFFGWDKSE